uniref:SFRICE_036634 n=1 Tax=Spodoptera frugiperda TaxID=7108 RepID=A0A2H1WMI5_SPOFR
MLSAYSHTPTKIYTSLAIIQLGTCGYKLAARAASVYTAVCSVQAISGDFLLQCRHMHGIDRTPGDCYGYLVLLIGYFNSPQTNRN